jgi:hypothetical protein
MSCKWCGGTRHEPGANYLMTSTAPCSRCRPFASWRWSVRAEWQHRTKFMDRVDWVMLGILAGVVTLLGVAAAHIFALAAW